MYRINVVADFDVDDRYAASRAYSAMSEAVGRENGDEQNYEIEWIGEGEEPALTCWCKAPASFAVPTVPSDGTMQPVCDQHIEGASHYESLQDMEDDGSLDEKLGLA